MYRINLTGRIFGKLTVLYPDETKTTPQTQWVCRCSCGEEHTVRMDHLLREETDCCKTCFRKKVGEEHRSHGQSRTLLYKVWDGMKDRCYNPNHHYFFRYGGRGITVCERWLHSFENFAADMGQRPSSRHCIERKNNDLSYTPDNCCWATYKEQARNRCTTILLTFQGETKSLTEWAEQIGMKMPTLHRRIKEGWDIERAFTQPVRMSKHA